MCISLALFTIPVFIMLSTSDVIVPPWSATSIPALPASPSNERKYFSMSLSNVT